jgi:hypothetical protein
MPVTAYKPKVYKKKTETNLSKRCSTYMRNTYPHVIFFCDASGVNMSDTARIDMAAQRSKGDRTPDMIIDFPSRGFHGARFELKQEGTVIYKKDGTLRKQPYVRRFRNGTVKRGDHLEEQAATLQKYNEAGYFSRFAVGFDKWKQMVDWYMENENASLF